MTAVPYPTEKLLTLYNVKTWDYYLLDRMSAYPVIGSAIRNGKKFILPVPCADDRMINSQENRYNFSIVDDRPVLTDTSRDALRIAQDYYVLAEAKRIEEEAKVCTLLKSSFSEEISLMLRTNLDYISADKGNDSFVMYHLVKAFTNRTCSFVVAQYRLLQLFHSKVASSHTVYKDEILTHYKAFQDSDAVHTNALLEEYHKHDVGNEGDMPLQTGFARKAKFWRVFLLICLLASFMSLVAAGFVNLTQEVRLYQVAIDRKQD